MLLANAQAVMPNGAGAPDAADEAAVPPPPPGRSPIDDVVDLASRLITVMTRENECLATMDLQGMKQLQDEKLQLTRAYTHRVYQIKKDPARLAALTQVMRDEIKKVMAKFDEVAKTNEKILRATRDANDRVLKAVVDAANSLSPRVAGYSRTGAMTKPYGNSRAPTPPPVSFNRCL